MYYIIEPVFCVPHPYQLPRVSLLVAGGTSEGGQDRTRELVVVVEQRVGHKLSRVLTVLNAELAPFLHLGIGLQTSRPCRWRWDVRTTYRLDLNISKFVSKLRDGRIRHWRLGSDLVRTIGFVVWHHAGQLLLQGPSAATCGRVLRIGPILTRHGRSTPRLIIDPSPTEPLASVRRSWVSNLLVQQMEWILVAAPPGVVSSVQEFVNIGEQLRLRTHFARNLGMGGY